jgi:hypothetical protein
MAVIPPLLVRATLHDVAADALLGPASASR